MIEEIVSLEWREKVPTKQMGDYLVADLGKIAAQIKEERLKAKQSMFITVAAIRTDKYKELNNTIRFCIDPVNGIMYGIANGILADGNIKWGAVILQEVNTYNLNLDMDAKRYAFVRMHPKVVGSPFGGGIDPVYKIIDEDKIAAQKGTKLRTVQQALHIAGTMKKDELLGFGRYLGIIYQIDASVNVIRTSIQTHAYENPFDFMDKYNNPSRKLNEVIKSAIVTGAITFNHDTGYKYRSIALGHTESEILVKFTSEPSLVNAIQADALKRDPTFKKLQTETEKKEEEETHDSLLEEINNQGRINPDETENPDI